MNKVLVMAVHPDDETLGCGGTLLRHKCEGDQIYWLVATSMKEEDGFGKNEIKEVEEIIENITKMYNFEKVFRLGIPTTRVDEFPIVKIVKGILKILIEVKPNIIYLPFMKDVHSDHRIIFEAAYSSIRTFHCPFIKKILMMETISETEFAPGLKEFAFIPNHFVNISNFLERKIEITKIFKREIGKHPFPRNPENIRALATFRGATAGCKYAESFAILKEIR